MPVTNTLLNSEEVVLTDCSYDIGTYITPASSGATNFLERPAIVILKGTGQACSKMLAVCTSGDAAINEINLSWEVEKQGITAIKVDVTEASATYFNYERAVDDVGRATLILSVRKMTLTLGEGNELEFEYGARAA